MSLYKEWVSKAYDKNGNSIKKIWDIFLPKEQKIYEYILSNKVTNISGTITELSQRFHITAHETCGFIDGINDILPNSYDMGALVPDSAVSIDIDFEKLYKKMVECKAKHLYDLPEWDNIFAPERREILFSEQKMSKTYVRDDGKIGRNDPCICGSGKKYKKCCGR